MKIKDLAYMSISLALLIICSKLTIPIGPIPLTLQTFSVIFIGLLLKFKKAFFVFTAYILMGIIGIPVFSQGGGFHYIFQPSFGYIIGFIGSAFFTGNSLWNKKWSPYIQSIIGLLFIHIIGILYMYFIMNFYYEWNKSISYVIAVGFTPFILKDSISSVLATFIYKRIEPFVEKQNYKLKKDENLPFFSNKS